MSIFLSDFRSQHILPPSPPPPPPEDLRNLPPKTKLNVKLRAHAGQ